MRYVFGDCTLDTDQYVLHRAGSPTALQPKVFSVLHYLLTHRDRVIAKRELTEQIWPDQFISDATLEGVIKSVRQAVGDTGRRQWCIQTRRGQGYRFVATLVEPDVIRSSDTEVLPAMRPERDAFRRQLTVVCCDLVEASQLARQLPPEDFRDVIQAYQAMCTDIIQRFEGSIAQDYGVEMMFYFGAPLAQEDASCRAIHTALAIVEALGLLNQRLQLMPQHRLSVRLGIHTGMAVVEEPSEGVRAQLAFGETPYVARELQALAEPDTVVISAATARLVHGLFVCRDLAVPPKSDGPIAQGLVQVLRASEAQSRFEVAQRQGLRPLVGREQELGQLWQCWEKIRYGRGYSVFICGEAGIGKSRLVEALQAMQAATLHARQLAHPPSLAWALLCLTLLHSLRREAAVVQACAVEVITLAAEAGFPFWVAVGTILNGWARAEQGSPEEGLQLIRQGLGAYQAIGAELGRPYFLALLAEAYGKIGAVDAGLEILAQALEAATSSGEGISWPELYRLRGELLLTQNDITPQNTSNRSPVREAEASLRQAAEIAARQGAKSWHLRAVLSLSRLWRLQGKWDLARRQLADVYNGFTEGFNTADLNDAKILLDAL